MLIGFTGSQSGMTQFQKDELFKILSMKECSEFIHGDCIGSDAEANNIALSVGVKLFTIHPPSNSHKRAFCFDPNKRFLWNRINTPFVEIGNEGVKVRWMPIEAYLERNKRIVDSVSLMIATPKEFTHTVRSGTWSTIRYAWKNKKDIIIIPPIDRPKNISEEEAKELFKEFKNE